MFSIWLNLFWKEWREHRWKLLVLTVIAFAVPVYSLATDPGGVPVSVMLSLLGLLSVAPIYVASGVAAGENRRGTLPFLQATPVTTRMWAIAKLAVGMATVLLPALALVLFLYGLESIAPRWGLNLNMGMAQRGLGALGFYQLQLAWILLGGTSVFIWSAAAGMNRSDEIRAAAWAVIVMVGYWCLLLGAFRATASYFGIATLQWTSLLVMPTAPGGMLPSSSMVLESPEGDLWMIWRPIIPFLLVHAMLVVWFVIRFGRASDLSDRSPQTATPDMRRAVAVRKPFGSRASAILWSQFRELGLVAALCPVATFGLGAVVAGLEEGPRYDFMDSLRNVLPYIWIGMGLLFSTVLGAGVFLRDVEPGLNAFWRSRPINPQQWFWTKYLAGIGWWVIALGIPAAVCVVLNRDLLVESRDWAAWASVACGGLAIFASSAAAMCLVRQPVYACLLSMGAVFISVGIAMWKLQNADGLTATTVLAVLLVGITAASTILAWLALRCDWGWQPAD